ncbi:serine/threonine-protein phosphatase family [Niveomyces insectorum RCEF 264]|uniref:Serine/threonine-protein phosphatase family n=1 Tax=Niveomyces insectorum RCEF 264 TaxID=1081102 RepID=A0A167UIP7_9HYPO|nr:serine/threonine-protein phosphatase family [Niveomyces insectorum RCEF 264]
MAAITVALAAFAPLVRAMQPSAEPALPAPMRPLQWGEINFLHTTDTHGWHAGHLQESQYSADWGDYVSFAEHMRQRADDNGVDLLLIDTGDRVEGNGLYDASTPKGRYTYDIFAQQPVDIICSGNHELYQADTVDREYHQTVPNFRTNYLASNLDYLDPTTGERRAMAPQRYRAFQTKNRRANVLAFGFIFNFTGNAANSVVQPVQETVREPWFQRALLEEPADLIVVIGHVGARMEELRVIYEAIRAQKPDTPIALFAGHAHVRDAVQFDDKALALASGRYFETIGWMSVSGLAADAASRSVTFQRRYIDNNLLGLYYHSSRNASTFPTDQGRNVTATIAAARADLHLDTHYGCAPKNYWLQRRPHDHPDSVFTLLRNHVLPDAIVRKDDHARVPRLILVNTGAMRFDIFRGAFTRDTTYIVSPFVSRLHYIPDVPYELVRQVLPILNNFGPILTAMVAADEARLRGVDNAARGTDWREMGVPEQYAGGSNWNDAGILGNGDGDGETIRQKPLSGSRDHRADNGGDGGDADGRPPLVAGYTTRDDLGTDGDDAIHEPLPHYRLPNCIQTEAGFPADAETNPPATVDFVFFDFIENFVLQALAYAAGNNTAYKHYTPADIETYIEGKFTDYFADWVKHNWEEQC